MADLLKNAGLCTCPAHTQPHDHEWTGTDPIGFDDGEITEVIPDMDERVRALHSEVSNG